ncbi:LapA family protein [Marinithermus hydrothermalis]|uniref:Uncharacterized protein n=1 Tax=Marinithermus hydrothermalis (strain DSM 14884 / JCM 11576 / T1) TaxID=869210 RepID=F2NP23_MARHT|nr:LapA family protein [Marinithermus hydrothermalis]AEB11611.1 hypothetical protein Marky_0865 [Marinithermus hydrothermalis DSM 14884]
MRLVHWLSFAILVSFSLAALFHHYSQPDARVALWGLGSLPVVWVAGGAFALGFLAGGVYALAWWLRALQASRTYRKEIARLQAEIEALKARHPEDEEVPRIPDRDLPLGEDAGA